MGITFKSFFDVLPFVAAIQKPVMLRSRHGVGKSTVVYQYAKKIGLPVIERRASQMTEGDLLGLPKLNNNVTEWCPPSWLKEACDTPVLLFIDELDRGTTEVRQGFFELCDSRKVAGHHLHPKTLVFAACNSGIHGAQYQVGELDPAELDRWTVFDLEPSVEDWLLWAKEANIHSVILDFINNNHQHLEHDDDFEPNKVYPSRRSWHRFSDCLTQGNLVEIGEFSVVVLNLATAFVGFEAAVAFTDYIKKAKKIITIEDVIDKGKYNLTKDFDINGHASLIDALKIKGYYKEKLTEKQLNNLAEYFKIVPPEIALKLWTDMGEVSAENGNLESVVAFHHKIGSVLASMLRSDNTTYQKMIEEQKKKDEK